MSLLLLNIAAALLSIFIVLKSDYAFKKLSYMWCFVYGLSVPLICFTIAKYIYVVLN